MRRLVLVCFVALAATQAAGCFFSSDDDDDVDDLGFILAQWDFETAAGDPVDCPADTIIVEARGPETIDDLFDCVDGQGESPEGHVIGDYDVTLVSADVDANGDIIGDEFAVSLTFEVDLIASDVVVAATGDKFSFVVDGGRPIVDHDLREAGTNVALSCADANIDDVEIRLAGVDTLISSLVCDDPDGIHQPLEAGMYDLDLVAIDASGAGAGLTEIDGVVIGDRNEYNDLGTIELVVDCDVGILNTSPAKAGVCFFGETGRPGGRPVRAC